MSLIVGLYIDIWYTMNQNKKPLLLNESLKETVTYHEDDHQPNQKFEKDLFIAISQNDDDEILRKKSRKRYTIIQILSIVCTVIALLFIFAMPPIIKMVIIQQASEQVIMAESNQGNWAHFPGSSGTVVLRNFTFFNLDNEWQFMFSNEKPVFKEITGYQVQELQDFLDIQYLDDGNLVKGRDWLRFAQWHESKNLQEKVTILNMANQGYWARMKSARPTLVLQQGLSLLFTNLEKSIIPNLYGSGLSQQYLKDNETLFTNLLSPSGISINSTNFLWNDPAYGMSDKENLGFWAIAAINCFENQNKSFAYSNDTRILKNYFGLTDGQTVSLMKKIYSYVTSLKNLLLENHYCFSIPMQQCTGRHLAIAQLAESWVTGNTPPVSTTFANDTICDDNITCKGLYPQPAAFAKNIFKISKKMGDLLDFNPETDTKFDRQVVLRWFNYNHSIEEGLDYNTAQNCLLHIGNLDALWQMGHQFEQKQDPKLLDPIQVRFELPSRIQTLIFWKWIKYIYDEFVIQNAGNQQSGVSNLFTSGLYSQFTYLQEHLQRFLLAKMLAKDIKDTKCEQFFKTGFDEFENQGLITSLCKKYSDIHTDDFSFMMVDTCQQKDGVKWNQLKSRGVGLLLLENLCDPQGTDNVGNKLHQYKLKFDQLYGCRVTPNPYCSNYEIALLQWQTSKITLNPPIEITQQLDSSTTFSTWDTKAKPVEYSYFINRFTPQQRSKFPQFTLDELFKQFTFEGLFSKNLMIKSLHQKTVNSYFYKYVRYVCVYLSLRGFSTTRSVREILFGYEDQYLKSIRQAYPPEGGDPSAQSYINLNQLNITSDQVTRTIIFKTGKKDINDVYQHFEINGFRYSVNNYSRFDGNKTVMEWKSPWAQNDYFYGTAGKIFPPNQFQSDNISILIPNIQRYGSNHFNGQSELKERYGMDVYITHQNPQMGAVNKQNDKYYQTIPSIFNVSSIYGLPMYICKKHFKTSEKWLSKIEIYNQNKTIHYTQPDSQDGTFILIEPWTGVSFQSRIQLQNNLYYQPDLLYDYPTDIFMPVFMVARGGGLSQQKFHQLYDPLVIALTARIAVVYIGVGLAIIFVLLFAFATVKKRKIKTSDKPLNKSELGISLQVQNHFIQNPSIIEQMNTE